MIIGGSGSGKTNTLVNLIKEQDNCDVIDKIYLYAIGLNEPNFQFIKCENAGIKHYNNLNAFIQCSYTMDKVYENIDDYNLSRKRKRKKLVAFDDMIADIMTNKTFQTKIKELFIRCRKLNISLVFITQSYFSVP